MIEQRGKSRVVEECSYALDPIFLVCTLA